MKHSYNKRVILPIRKAMELTQREMSNLLGISIGSFRNYESGRSRGSEFFYQRMMEVFGIDLRQHPDLNKIVFCNAQRVKSEVYRYLNTLEIIE
ncbi:XRE family transcriptional regulator [Chitinophaga silvatica]|uniref:XRE family transcriptional regulator n=1 Tax=Chitinophaga silvatica TaxID=2282649 RepID=A0A3E1YAV4_9BACT|nr:helix-turn-helix transcriptional regulator [Chitinophaga silvatica]RFS22812.1 XRE family transcriptional regulator [Chitinophaga silvatica]